jgi:hypothetical protein
MSLTFEPVRLYAFTGTPQGSGFVFSLQVPPVQQVISKLDIGDPSLIFLDQKRCAFV